MTVSTIAAPEPGKAVAASPGMQPTSPAYSHTVKERFGIDPEPYLDHGSIVIAAITSCTNTSNPSVMVAAGLLAKKAVEKGLAVPPWVKTSLAPPGSRVVTDYYQRAGLLPFLDKLRFNIVGYGCTTCIGNSGPLPSDVSEAIDNHGPRRRFRAQRQSQLRGPDQLRRARQLSHVAPAGPSPMRSPEPSTATSRPSRWDAARMAQTSSCAISGPRLPRLPLSSGLR